MSEEFFPKRATSHHAKRSNWHAVIILGEGILDEAQRTYPYAKSAIARWRRITQGASWQNFVDIKQHFNAPDSVGKCVVFDIKHDDFRLIAIVDYARSLVVVKAFLKHADYDREGWKSGCSKGS